MCEVSFHHSPKFDLPSYILESLYRDGRGKQEQIIADEIEVEPGQEGEVQPS